MPSHNPKSSKIYWGVLAFILGFTIASRLIGLDKGIWLDEFSSINVITTNGSLISSLRNYDHPPLYFLLLALWRNVIGDSESSFRLLSVVVFVVMQIICFFWIKKQSKPAAMVAVFLVATTPILFRYSQEIRHYQLLLTLTCAVFWVSALILEEGNNRTYYVALTVLLTVTMFVHLAGIFVIPMLLVYMLLDGWLNTRPVPWLKLALTLIIPFISFLFLYFWFLTGISKASNWWMPYPSSEVVMATANTVFSTETLFFPLQYFSNQPFLASGYDFIIKGVLGLFCILLLFGSYRKSLPYLTASFTYWLALYLYSIWFTPIFWYRTVLPGLIPFIGFLAVQITSIKNKKIKYASYLLIGLLGSTFATGWMVNNAQTPIENWKSVSETLVSRVSADDAIIIYPKYAVGPLAYYFPDLKTSDFMYAPNLGDLERAVQLARENLESTSSTSDSRTIYLVIRNDASVSQNSEDYRDALKLLDDNLTPTILLQDGLLILTQYK